MSIKNNSELASYCKETAVKAKHASRLVAALSTNQKNNWLLRSAEALRNRTEEILIANRKDLARVDEFGLSAAQVDRLNLTEDRIAGIATAVEEIASLPDPIGEVLSTVNRPNGLKIEKVRDPLGVIFFIYESRPNVTVDAAAICLKSGNAVILRGGKEAAFSSNAMVNILLEVGEREGLPDGAIQLVQTPDRNAVQHFLSLDKQIDLAIPRGGEGLIRNVAQHATMPVLKHYHGNCHVFVDASADQEKAIQIIINAKCQRPGVCNACESLIIHEEVASEFLPRICHALTEQGVEMVGDEKTCQAIASVKPMEGGDFAREFLALKISICQVANVEQAIEHINQYGSGHTDAIVTESQQSASLFASGVDSSAVMLNASTRFNDGSEFGLGAEIGISTDKFHARGPCGLNELTTYKYVCHGNGQIR